MAPAVPAPAVTKMKDAGKAGKDEDAKNGADDEGGKDKKEKWDVNNPPGDWKEIRIDTDQTTWSAVDVSPDGGTVVFDMLGDIYTVPIGGGEASPLTHEIAWDIQPRYSPDGKKIAFISDRGGASNLWVMDADGKNMRAVTEEKEHLVFNPWWSPDGDYILAKKGFMSTRSIAAGEIWLFHEGGGGGMQITERPFKEKDQKNMAGPSFSPDGRYIYYSQDVTPGQRWQYDKDSTGQIFAIKRFDRETGETDTFVNGPGGAIRPTPSPDGKYLAFVKRTPAFTSAIYLKDLVSGEEWPIYDKLDRDLQETNGSEGNTPGFSWTPDSASIVFWAGGDIRRVWIESKESKVIPVHVRTTEKVRKALRFPVDVAPDEFPVRMIRWAQYSPDGSEVAFQALGHVWIEDLATKERRRLTSQDEHFEYYPSFSRDGKWIVYVTWDDQDLGSVRVAPATGGEGRVLTEHPGHYLEPKFSPDGTMIVYRKTTGGFLTSGDWSLDPGIYIVPIVGGESKRVSRSGHDAQFADSDTRVYFSDDVEDTKLALKSVNLDGHDEQTHLKGDKVTEFSLSPDGRWVAFTENYNAWVAPFTITGKTVSIDEEMKSMPVRQVSKRSGEFLHWSADSTKLHWSNGATLYTRDLKDAFSFLAGAPDKLPEPVEQGLDLSWKERSDKPNGMIALTGGRVVTMRGAREGKQEVIENGVVLVKGNRIEAVGKAGEVSIPADAVKIDVTGKTVIPGLIDVHEHGSMAAHEMEPEQNWMQYSNLSMGVTTIHDPSNDTSEVFSAAEMQRAGLIVGPRIFSTGTILYGAHVPGLTAMVTDLEDAKFHIQRLKDVGAISVKSYNQPRRDSRQEIIEAGQELGIMVVPEGGAKYQYDISMVIDGHTGIEHAIPIETGYDDLRQLWSQTEVEYTPTFVVAYGGLEGETYWYQHTDVWKDEHLMRYVPRFIVEPKAMRRLKAPEEHYNHFHVARFAKTLRDSGVGIHIGAHGQREGLGAHWELWMMNQGGFTPWEAFRSGTIDGAHYLGMDGDIGSIEKGKLADMAVIDGNPLEDIRRSENVVYTMINGRVYESATMNQIAPDKVERQPFFFEKEGGDTIAAGTLEYFHKFAEDHGWEH
ncbi:MAG TPA: amidohydrolase family protein [Candidatus Saccharimonadales bacterium]|nr:amidohydrolase family protein [Candidatus Saccharimonadales bacterium]